MKLGHVLSAFCYPVMTLHVVLLAIMVLLAPVADGNFIQDLVYAAAPQDSDLATG
jgi:hypothetical protein